VGTRLNKVVPRTVEDPPHYRSELLDSEEKPRPVSPKNGETRTGHPVSDVPAGLDLRATLTQGLRPGLNCAACFGFASGQALRGWSEMAGAKAQTHDLRRINRAAAPLNAEAADVLRYQFSKG
jgi:hypothetical protein